LHDDCSQKSIYDQPQAACSMNKGTLGLFLLFLIGGIALAEVYKWVDESGKVHYGDAPPAESGAESVALPEGPSQEEVERARQQMQERIEKYEKLSGDASPPEPLQEPSPAAKNRVFKTGNVACFSPLSDVVKGPLAETDASVTPDSLTESQQKSLYGLFDKAGARWQGTITDTTCTGSASAPGSKIMHLAARTTVDWDARHSRLTIETDTTGKESRAVERLVQRFEVGAALYFADFETEDTIARDGNKVELLALDRNSVSFLIKRRFPVALRFRSLREEVRYLEITDRTLKLTELYYYNSLLAGSRTWDLGR